MIVCLFASVSFAQTFINFTAEQQDSFNAVLVEKDGKWLHVIKVSEGSATVLKSWQVLTGGSEGDKMVQGDEKTPEGLYFVTGFLSPAKLKEMYGSEVSKMYGSGAYPLSYPNIKDRLNRKTGGGIWLHGVDPERKEPATKGCVAFENDNLELLSDYIGVGTPVIITNEGLEGTIEDLHDHYVKAKQNVDDFIEAWGSNNIDAFKSYYGENFKDTGGRSLDGYFKYKKYLMDLFPYRYVEAENYRVFTQKDGEYVAEFDQFYCAPNVVSYGRKRFYYEDNKIVTEEFSQRDASPYLRRKVNEFLLNWKNAWESLNIDSYMSVYADDFSSAGMDKSAWQADKAGKFANLKEVKVQVENISFKAVSPVSYIIEFRQIYQGDEYSDAGTKTLRVTGCPGDFKIKSETWRAQ
ncbi:MAG: murein L,D-transpeptidase family protein [Deferribacterales bacterium]